jgi:sugar-specific transcriptional regulator TrmB
MLSFFYMDVEKVLMDTSDMTQSQAKVYLSIVELGECRVGEIIQNTNMQSSVVHNALITLIEKGFLSFILKNKIKHYYATEPENIREYIQTKKDEFEKIMPKLKVMKTKADIVYPKVEVFTGKKGMLIASLKIFEKGEKGDIHKYFGVSSALLNEEIIAFFEMLEIRRKAMKLIVKGISTIENKNKLKDYKLSELRFVKEEIPPAMSIFKDRILLMSFEEKFNGILIESEELAGQYHKLWDSIWKKSS